MQEIAQFVRQHYEPSQMWPDEDLHRWLEWAGDNGFLTVIFDEGEIVGLAVFRPITEEIGKRITRPDDKYDENGDIIYVDLAISTKGTPVLQAILFGILARLGNRERIALHVLKSGQVKIHDLQMFKKNLFNRGKSHNG